MKKSERIENSNRRADDVRRYAEEDRVMQELFCECQPFLTTSEWQEYYENMWQQGKWFHAFHCLMYALAEYQIEITPKLRKMIDACLEVHKVKRDQVSELRDLKYDDYWRQQYGY